MAKLTEEQVLVLRQEYKAGRSLRELALQYGVNRSTIHRAATNRYWQHASNPNGRRVAHNYRHGCEPRATYQIWKGMKRRCYSPDDRSYRNYGARGIKVHPRWLYSFDAFLIDMGAKPSGRTLERIDNDGDYCPGNCCWATPQEQAANRRLRRIPPVRDRDTNRFVSSAYSKCLKAAIDLAPSEQADLITALQQLSLAQNKSI